MLSLQHTKQDGGRTALTRDPLDFVRETWSRVPYHWQNGLIYSYAYVSVVLTSDISNITISTTRTENFDNLVLMLMSRLSSLRHKTRYAYVYAYSYVVVRTRLKGSLVSFVLFISFNFLLFFLEKDE